MKNCDVQLCDKYEHPITRVSVIAPPLLKSLGRVLLLNGVFKPLISGHGGGQRCSLVSRLFVSSGLSTM